jgi:hypothetical protein
MTDETGDREIVIGFRDGDHVSIKPIGVYGGWVKAEIYVYCDGWSGRTKGEFLPGQLSKSAREIRRLRRELTGSALFESLEPQIAIRFSGDGKGHIGVEGSAQNGFLGARLVFRFDIDQTFLDQIARALDRLESRT